MRVIRIRAWVRRALYSLLVLLLLMLLVLESEIPIAVSRLPYQHIPSDYILHRARNPHLYDRSGCVSTPGFNQIQYSTAFWQHVSKPSEPNEPARAVLVYAAYWDAREQDKPLVRLLVHSELELPRLLCLFWYYNKGDPVAVESSAPADPDAGLHVVSCTPPARIADTPAALSLAAAGLTCGMTRNILGIRGISVASDESPPTTTSEPGTAGRRRFAVCAMWWRRGDAAVRLAEWLQMLRYLRVDHVYFYVNHNAHENVLRVIDYYSYNAELDGMTIEVTPYFSPPINGTDFRAQTRNPIRITPGQGNDFEEYSEAKQKDDILNSSDEEDVPPIHESDLLPYNECIYRAMLERVEWVAPLDLDEIILPARHGSWAKLAFKETVRARSEVGETPDVLEFERWWFPEMLQTDLAPPSTWPAYTYTQLRNRPGAEPGISPAPLVVPPGRMFAYQWRIPTARADEAVTGRLIRVTNAVGVTRRGVRCRFACSVRVVRPDVARVHLYTWGCGGASRSVCRVARRRAVREDTLWKWRRAQQEADLTLRQIQLQPHSRIHADEL